MLRGTIIVAVSVGAGVLIGCSGQAESRENAGGSPPALTAQDYIDIQQLVARYAYAVDTCSNNGYDYADLFAPDGVFIGWGGRRWEGRDSLAEAAGGGVRECRKVEDPPPHSHVIANLIIEPSDDGGATGRSYLVYPGVRGQHGDANHSGHVGGYEDEYVKTADGWRFKVRTRIH